MIGLSPIVWFFICKKGGEKLTKEEKLKRIVDDPLLWIKHFCTIVNK